MSGLRSSRYLLEAPMVIRNVLAVRKHLQITNIIIFDNFDFKTVPKTQSLGISGLRSSRNIVCASNIGQGLISLVQPIFLDPGGQDESTGTPHLTLPPNPSLCQGGGVTQIYIRIHIWFRLVSTRTRILVYNESRITND